MKCKISLAIAGVVVGGFGLPIHATEVSFSLQAQEFVAGVPWLKPGIPIPIADDGRIVFPVEAFDTFDDGLIARTAGVNTPINLAASNYDEVNSVAINAAGNIAFVSNRTSGTDNFRGVYRTTSSAASITTIHEDAQTFDPGPAARFVALSENGTVAFSTIDDSFGAIYRGPVAGAPSVLRSGSGTFFNTQRLDVNDAGTVAVQMEHTRPFGGLGRGILAFDTPEQPLTSNKTAIEQTGVGVQPMPSINSSGQVAFSLDTTITMTFYDPPNIFGGTVLDTITLTPGVYVTTPAPYGQLPRSYTQIANNTGAFNTFSRVVINDAGVVVFEASLDGGGFGLFSGANPVTDKILLTGETLEPSRIISFIELGELNNANQFTLFTSWFGGDRQVWIATIPEPATLAWLIVPVLMRRRRRMK